MNQTALSVVLVLLAGTCGIPAIAEAARGEKLELPERYHEMRKKTVCVDEFTFDEVEETHWEVGQRIRVIGPLPNDNVLVHVLRTGSIKPRLYQGYNASTTEPPSVFYLETIVREHGKHESETSHPQWMYVLTWDQKGCPSEIEFYSEYDMDDKGTDDHGGHAHAVY